MQSLGFIHGRENLSAMLENLGADATIFVHNETKFNQMPPGNQILKSLELLAKVELGDRSIADQGNDVKQGMEPTNFKVKEEPSTAATGKDAESAIQENSSGDSITENGLPVKATLRMPSAAGKKRMAARRTRSPREFTLSRLPPSV